MSLLIQPLANVASSCVHGACGCASLPASQTGPQRLDDAELDRITSWYRGAVAKGITDNQGRRHMINQDGLRLAKRFRDHQDMILRFATDLAVGFTSNQADYGVSMVMRSGRWDAGRGGDAAVAGAA